MSEYYDGTKLLSMKDINGDTPEIYFCTGNKTGGKTTYFNRLLVNSFLKGKGQFMLLYRFKYEVKDAHIGFFNDIKDLFFPGYIMKSQPIVNGSFYELILVNKTTEEPKSCGFAVPLSAVDNVKKFSHIFKNVNRMLLDEFQSESNHYATNELSNFRAIHTAVARGNNQHVRYVPVYLLSNALSLLNPYYKAFNIGARLNNNTKFLKGVGWVLEQAYIESAANAQKDSAFNRAFGNDKHNQFEQQNVYFLDNINFVQKVNGKGDYVCTVKYKGDYYGVRLYYDQGIVYCNDKPDKYNPNKIAVTTDDHSINYLMLERSNEMVQRLRWYFLAGMFRFKNLDCKECILQLISYT